jgi:hypothetical protein
MRTTRQEEPTSEIFILILAVLKKFIDSPMIAKAVKICHIYVKLFVLFSTVPKAALIHSNNKKEKLLLLLLLVTTSVV